MYLSLPAQNNPRRIDIPLKSINRPTNNYINHENWYKTEQARNERIGKTQKKHKTRELVKNRRNIKRESW